MKPLVDRGDFPGSEEYAYLNAASVALMYSGAAQELVAWFEQLAAHGTARFDEAAEETVFDALRAAAARLFNAQREDIAVSSNASAPTQRRIENEKVERHLRSNCTISSLKKTGRYTLGWTFFLETIFTFLV